MLDIKLTFVHIALITRLAMLLSRSAHPMLSLPYANLISLLKVLLVAEDPDVVIEEGDGQVLLCPLLTNDVVVKVSYQLARRWQAEGYEAAACRRRLA